MSEPPERIALYRLYDVSDQLLYVGITSNLRKRWQAHARDKHWWQEVAHKDVEWFERRKSAERIEKIEIETENPVYNRTFNGDRRRELQNADSREASQPVPTEPIRDPLDIYYCFPQ